MKKLLWCLIIISFMLSTSACSKGGMFMVLEDISRDTYEKNARAQRHDNIINHTQTAKEPLTYDQYQRERKELMTDQTLSATETDQ